MYPFLNLPEYSTCIFVADSFTLLCMYNHLNLLTGRYVVKKLLSQPYMDKMRKHMYEGVNHSTRWTDNNPGLSHEQATTSHTNSQSQCSTYSCSQVETRLGCDIWWFMSFSIRQINNSLYQNHVATHISYPTGQVLYIPDAVTRQMWDNAGASLNKSVTGCTLSNR